MVRQQREAYEKDKGKEKKRQSGSFGGQSSFKRPLSIRASSRILGGPVSPQPSRSVTFVEGHIDHCSVRSATGGAIGGATYPQSATGVRLQPCLLHRFHLVVTRIPLDVSNVVSDM